jgi:hypothetical protein
MAEIANTGTRDTLIFPSLSNGDTTQWMQMPAGQSLGASIQAEGSFGSGTVTVEVSNDATNAHALTLVDGTAAPTLTADGIIEVSTGCRMFRASLSGGSGGDVTITAFGAG